MDPAYYGLIEMALVFGGVLAYCAYGIWSIDRRRAARAQAERAAAAALAADTAAAALAETAPGRPSDDARALDTAQPLTPKAPVTPGKALVTPGPLPLTSAGSVSAARLTQALRTAPSTDSARRTTE